MAKALTERAVGRGGWTEGEVEALEADGAAAVEERERDRYEQQELFQRGRRS
ncbi:hypothetical protein [Paraconexibacter algicola]|uniref:hypothetical protein n=1 Tax=Paraconexibacter algicola TaxID=2133960 RepID=UPI001304D9F5|nr:hypothetical protein [Paraconexibacter algicola]